MRSDFFKLPASLPIRALDVPFFALFAVVLCAIQATEIFIIIPLCLFSMWSPKYRKHTLTAACLVSLLLIDRFGLPFDIAAYHLIPYFIFNAIFILIFDRFERLRRHYMLVIFSLIIFILFFQYSAGQIFGNTRLALMLTAPIIMNIWTYMNYVKVPLPELSFIERVIWLRPFWYGWLLPYGSNVDIKKSLFISPQLDVAKFRRYTVVGFGFALALFCLENMIFLKPYVFAAVDWLPRLSDIPMVSREGYQIAFDRYPVGIERSELGQALRFLFIQSAAVVHFILYIGLYSTSLITLAVLAGFDIPLHVQDMWSARTFSEFYIKTNYHYSYLIRTHLMPTFARFRIPWLRGRLMQAWVVGASVFIVSEISMYFGRSLWLGSQLDFFGRIAKSTGNLHYAALTAVICAVNVFFRSPHVEMQPSIVPRVLKVIAFFLIFQFSLIFGFQFLRTAPQIKMEYAKVVLKLVSPLSYLR